MCGERAVFELVRGAPERVEVVLIDERRTFEELDQLVAELASASGRTGPVVAPIKVRRVAPDLLADYAPPDFSRGVLALARSPLLEDIEDLFEAAQRRYETTTGRQVLVALDGVVDPRNLGAILRSAEFFGAGGAFWARDRSAALSPAAIRASAGATERLPLCAVTNLSRALTQLREQDYWIVGTVVEGGESMYSLSTKLPDRIVLVMGSEEQGIRRLTREHCDYLLSIPAGGTLGSLNVSAAAAAVLAILRAP